MPSLKSIFFKRPAPEPESEQDFQPDWQERYQEADIPERHRPPRRTQKINLLSFLLTSIACFVCVLLIFSYTRLTVLNDKIAKAKDNLSSLRNESVKLTAEYDSRYDLSEIELYAQEELGMTKLDNSQVEYVEIGAPDTITRKTTNRFSFAAIGETIANMVNALLNLFE